MCYVGGTVYLQIMDRGYLLWSKIATKLGRLKMNMKNILF